MRRFGTKDWARLAMKFGLLLSDAKLWAAVNDQIRDKARDKAEDIGDVVRDKFRAAASPFDNGPSVFQARNDWVAPVTSFLGGVGVGIGLGILFTPVPGSQVRTTLRDSIIGVKNRVADLASRATGTEGDRNAIRYTS